MDGPDNEIDAKINDLCSKTGEIRILEMDKTYTNTPESVESLKKDLAFYFSGKVMPEITSTTPMVENSISSFPTGLIQIFIMIVLVMIVFTS